jgi:hypothetical protein
MGIREEMEMAICLPDQMSGAPLGWRTAMRRVAIFWLITDGLMGRRPFLE